MDFQAKKTSEANATNDVFYNANESYEANGNEPNEGARPEDRLPPPLLASMDPLAGHIIVRLMNEVRALRNEKLNEVRALRNENRALRNENLLNEVRARRFENLLNEVRALRNENRALRIEN